MTVKYGRNGFRGAAAGTHGHTGRLAGRSLEPKRRLLYIYIGILLFCLLMLLFQGLGLQDSLALRPEQEGIGIVSAKDEHLGQYVVTVDLVPPDAADPAPLRGEARVPKDSFDSVAVGDPLHVVYQLNQKGTAIVVRALRAVPEAPDPAQDGAFSVEFEAPAPESAQ